MRDRIVGFKRVKASELVENPDNARLHPQEQQQAMSGLLEEIGFADAIIVREVNGKYQLLDGHMRRRLLGDGEVPVVIVDLNDEEAAGFLLTFDGVKQLATKDTERVNILLDRAFATSGAVREMLNKMSSGAAKANPMPVGGNSTRARVEVLSCGKYRVAITNEEAAKLTLLARRYSEQNGSYLKFVDWILKKVEGKRATSGLSVGGTEGGGVQPQEDQ